MKRFRICLAALVLFSFIITGCPVSTAYPLGEMTDALPFDNNLIGTWKTDENEAEAKVVKIEKGDAERSYKVKITEKGSMFMADSEEFKGWITELGGRKFLVLMEMHTNSSKKVYFVYHLTIAQTEIITNDVTLKVGGTDAVTSVKAYQEEVLASMKKEDFLAGKIVWKKE